MALLSFAGILAYLGLAIWGEGGFAPFFSHPPLVALAAVTVVLVIVSQYTTASLSPGEKEDRRNRWVLSAFGILGILAGWVPAYTDRKEFWTMDGETLRWIGVTLYAVGGAIRIWPVFVLGRRFSGLVAIQPGHTLVTTGIYRFLRHPSYLGLLINALGWALAFRSAVGVILAVLMLVPLVARIRSEEALLLSQFGSAYEQYRARTYRLLPGIY
jgi:protein-S-isoprenylcysteine O-methyltransferase Ste14